ncbi:hypothetical protein LSAT2_017419 [Lamellibrachia satsuma]|nr:hypothetical protein LSAT2_017419 [Lamellibrachia satsuma]
MVALLRSGPRRWRYNVWLDLTARFWRCALSVWQSRKIGASQTARARQTQWRRARETRMPCESKYFAADTYTVRRTNGAKFIAAHVRNLARWQRVCGAVIAALYTSKHISCRWTRAEGVSSRTRENCFVGYTLKCVLYMCRSTNRERVSGYIVVGESLFVVSVNGRILRFHQERQRPVLTFQSLSTLSYYRQVRFDVTR